MKILFIVKTAKGANWAYRRINYLLESYPDMECHVVSPRLDVKGKLKESERLVCHEINNRWLLSLPIELIKLNYLYKFQFFYVWFFLDSLIVEFLNIFLGKRVIYEVVGPRHLEEKFLAILDVLMSSKRSVRICTSRFIYNLYIRNGMYAQKLMYCPVDLTLEGRIPPRQKKTEEPYVIGTASYFYGPKSWEREDIKGYYLLLDSFERLIKKRKDVELFIAGTNFYEKDIDAWNKFQQDARRRVGDKVKFLGEYKDIRVPLQKMDIFLYLSKSENLGGVYESLFYQTPTIASEVGGLPELVIDGVTGLLVDRDPAKIANLIDDYFNGKTDFSPTFISREIVETMFQNNERIKHQIFNKIFYDYSFRKE